MAKSKTVSISVDASIIYFITPRLYVREWFAKYIGWLERQFQMIWVEDHTTEYVSIFSLSNG